jgi:hypothetical protein
MTNNLSSFLRFKYSSSKGGGGPVNEEQDLGGFDGGAGPSTTGGSSAAKLAARDAMEKRTGMGTIQEGADEEASPGSRGSGAMNRT